MPGNPDPSAENSRVHNVQTYRNRVPSCIRTARHPVSILVSGNVMIMGGFLNNDCLSVSVVVDQATSLDDLLLIRSHICYIQADLLDLIADYICLDVLHVAI